MKSILEPLDLDLPHVRVIVQGMVQVAQSDGAHERELLLIREFYESCRDDAKGLADFGDLAKTPFDAEVAREVLDSDLLKLTFLVSCYLVAYADGHVSDGERRALEELTKGAGIGDAVAAHAQELVKDQLLMQVVRSANLPALQGIVKAL
jgi:uncharacterized membrane protein YebE (DUF533 family)